ncbi:hypothetical protein FKM82_001764 [Ascaphus truei]
MQKSPSQEDLLNMQCSEEDDSCLLPVIQESSDEASSESEAETLKEDLERESELIQKQLQDFEEISQKLLAELSMLEAENEIERSCREQAEVYATQVSKENQKLKRISMQVMPMLYQLPEEIQILVNEDQDITDPVTDTASEYQQQIKDLQETIRELLEGKKESAIVLEELRSNLRRLNEELEDERLERACILMTLEKNQRTLLKFKKVSLMVSEEYSEMMQQLEIEQGLRQHAEVFAHKMLREQQVANRQSKILMHNVEPSVIVVKALEEVRSLATSLEETKQELQTKVMSLESQLAVKPSREEFELIQEAFNATKEDKCKLETQLKEAEGKCTLLEEKVSVLEEKLKEAESLPCKQDELAEAPTPPPPPPPPPLPPSRPSMIPENPITLIKQRRGMRGAESDPTKAGCSGVKDEAVKEMMDRIKNGVVLRPARRDGQRQSAAASKRKSIINELQGILGDTMKKPARQASYRRISRKVKTSELEGVLLRRRNIADMSPLGDVAAEKARETRGKDESQPPIMPWSKENSPVLVKMRRRPSDLQQSRRMAPGTAYGLVSIADEIGSNPACGIQEFS